MSQAMPTQELSDFIICDRDNLGFYKDPQGRRTVIYHGRWYRNLHNLVQECALLRDHANLKDQSELDSFAKTLLFFERGFTVRLDESVTPKIEKGRFRFTMIDTDGKIRKVEAPTTFRPPTCGYKYGL